MSQPINIVKLTFTHQHLAYSAALNTKRYMSYRVVDNSFLSRTVPLQVLSAHQATAISTLKYSSTMQASQKCITTTTPECKSSLDPCPFPLPTVVDPWIMTTLVKHVFNDNIDPLRQAVETARSKHIRQMKDWGLRDVEDFLLFASGMLIWVPSETCDGKLIYNTLCVFFSSYFFILDQNPLNLSIYSTQICPESVNQPLARLSKWTVNFAKKIGD